MLSPSNGNVEALCSPPASSSLSFLLQRFHFFPFRLSSSRSSSTSEFSSSLVQPPQALLWSAYKLHCCSRRVLLSVLVDSLGRWFRVRTNRPIRRWIQPPVGRRVGNSELGTWTSCWGSYWCDCCGGVHPTGSATGFDAWWVPSVYRDALVSISMLLPMWCLYILNRVFSVVSKIFFFYLRLVVCQVQFNGLAFVFLARERSSSFFHGVKVLV